MDLLSPNPRVIYLHGFASGPASRKAVFFTGRCRTLGIEVETPDLAEGDFPHLTLSKQLKLLENITRNEPTVLIGSSLGGYLAALHAAHHPNVLRLILLAPAFDFYRIWITTLGPERLAAWKEAGAAPVYHYSAGREMPLSYEFLTDAAQFEPFPLVRQPVLLFHGDRDPVVPIEKSIAFTERAPDATLIRLPSGHELTDVLDPIWHETSRFLLPAREL